jgi:hypothetical protein
VSILAFQLAGLFTHALSQNRARRTIMTTPEHISGIDPGIDAVPRAETAASLSNAIKSLARLFVTWADNCGNNYAAAAIYGQLTRLSNAELHKRGLSRDTLARNVLQSRDTTAER